MVNIENVDVYDNVKTFGKTGEDYRIVDYHDTDNGTYINFLVNGKGYEVETNLRSNFKSGSAGTINIGVKEGQIGTISCFSNKDINSLFFLLVPSYLTLCPNRQAETPIFIILIL